MTSPEPGRVQGASDRSTHLRDLIRRAFDYVDAHMPRDATVARFRIGTVEAAIRSSTHGAAELAACAFAPSPRALDPATPIVRIDLLDGQGRTDLDWLQLLASVPPAPESDAPAAKRYWTGGPTLQFVEVGDTGTCMIYDAKQRRALVRYPSVAMLPSYERAAPMRDLVHWLHALDGNLLVHGAAVGTEGAGLLLVGPGGRGKSTVATTLLRRGFSFAGEDYVAIDPSTRRAYGVYTSVKLLPGDVERHASVRAERIEPAHDRDDKVALLLDETPPGFVEGIELVAVAAPHVTPEATDSQDPGWARVAPATMVAALAPSTLFQTVGFRHTTFAACAHVVKSLPTYTWTPGPLDGAYDERLELHARAILRDALEAA